jgi:hypothetical protein
MDKNISFFGIINSEYNFNNNSKHTRKPRKPDFLFEFITYCPSRNFKDNTHDENVSMNLTLC